MKLILSTILALISITSFAGEEILKEYFSCTLIATNYHPLSDESENLPSDYQEEITITSKDNNAINERVEMRNGILVDLQAVRIDKEIVVSSNFIQKSDKRYFVLESKRDTSSRDKAQPPKTPGQTYIIVSQNHSNAKIKEMFLNANNGVAPRGQRYLDIEADLMAQGELSTDMQESLEVNCRYFKKTVTKN